MYDKFDNTPGPEYAMRTRPGLSHYWWIQDFESQEAIHSMPHLSDKHVDLLIWAKKRFMCCSRWFLCLAASGAWMRCDETAKDHVVCYILQCGEQISVFLPGTWFLFTRKPGSESEDQNEDTLWVTTPNYCYDMPAEVSLNAIHVPAGNLLMGADQLSSNRF